MKLIDLNHEIENGMITYRGLPAPVITDFLSREASRKNYAPGTEFHIGKIEMVANTGTYVDSPFHRYENGADLAALPLESLANLEGALVRTMERESRAVGPEWFRAESLHGKAVLIHTGWDVHWRTERYHQGHPYVTREAAQLLAHSEAKLVGIDSFNIDDTADGSRPAHSLLLEAGIPIVEHMCQLELLPTHGFRFFAVPARVRKFGTFPVRAFAIVD
ncbi:MAG TPA: cyclase family protein [Acidobacteriota bacterium]|nr:cyclase family protein [Acidobacteriota bacterium]